MAEERGGRGRFVPNSLPVLKIRLKNLFGESRQCPVAPVFYGGRIARARIVATRFRVESTLPRRPGWKRCTAFLIEAFRRRDALGCSLGGLSPRDKRYSSNKFTFAGELRVAFGLLSPGSPIASQSTNSSGSVWTRTSVARLTTSSPLPPRPTILLAPRRNSLLMPPEVSTVRASCPTPSA